MELLSRAIVLPLILFVICSFRVCRAQDCGGNHVTHTIVVDQCGRTKFRTIQAAIDSIAQNNNQWVKIHINPGTYTEKVQIPYDKPCIFLEGQGRGVTTITYNDHQRTDTSATFSSFPDNVLAAGITFENCFNIGAGENLQTVVPAVAARIYGNKSAFYDCGFIGYQDTLWDVEGRHYFKNCYIEGAVDFIFGNGQSYYENCMLNATFSGFVTAQGRSSENDPSGFVFRGGSVVGSGESLLGRAYGPFSRVVFYGTDFSSVVAPQGWSAWNYSKREARFTYIEADCKGAGANTTGRVPWMKKLDGSEMGQFSRPFFIDQDRWLAHLPVYLRARNCGD